METTSKPVQAKPSYYAIMFEPLKQIALKYGYNLVLHGSLNRDMDLIAIPWSETIGSADEMIEDFCRYVDGEIQLSNRKQAEDGSITGDRFTLKPHGRINYIINVYRGGYLKGGGFHDIWVKDPEAYLDISVIPALRNYNQNTLNITEEKL